MMLKAVLTLVAMTYVAYTVAEVTTACGLTLIDPPDEGAVGILREAAGRPLRQCHQRRASRAGEAYLSVAQLIAVVLQTVIYVGLATLISWRFTLVASRSARQCRSC